MSGPPPVPTAIACAPGPSAQISPGPSARRNEEYSSHTSRSVVTSTSATEID
jgi:hypothetical protein